MKIRVASTSSYFFIVLFAVCLFFSGCIPEEIELPVSFKTSAIDLGLSVKWASCNVGADSPEEYGDYFAWGETMTKSSYTEGNSVTYGLSIEELKSRGIIDAAGNLTAAYDAATANRGEKWRMPTRDEMMELINECKWEWTSVNGVNGQLVTGPNGNSIFLPAAGYWSATPGSGSGGYSACGLDFGAVSFNWFSNNRNYGQAVRPVYGTPKLSVSVTTGNATDITGYGATLSGTITISNSNQSLTCGIIYGTSSSLSSTDGTMVATTSSEIFSVSISGLTANTTYYYRAYVIDNGVYKYGDVRSFSTKKGITVTTGDATNITMSEATLSGSIADAEQPLTCGIIYGTSSSLSSTDGTMVATTSLGIFSVNISGLAASTTYYYCAYVVVDGEYKYGDVRSFTTEADISITAGDAIDLGLSVKWASCNVGADSPEEYGDYFAWGETTTKSSYTVDNSVTYGLSISELKSRGIIGADGNLTSAYDAATANWGEDWRMPTMDEMKELVNECEWEWTSVNGVNGRLVTGPNGNSIFLPAAGYRYGTKLGGAGSCGGYWSATPLSDGYSDGYSVCRLNFNSVDYDWSSYSRYDGLRVRPVSEE